MMTEGISLSEASRRHGIPLPTLSGWVKRGTLRVVDRKLTRNGTGSPVYVDAGEVEAVARLYRPGRRGGRRPYSPAA